MKLFKTHGFEATTIDDITAKADVAKGTFFNYFPKKDTVLQYLSEQWLEEVEDKIAAEFQGTTPNRDRMIAAFVEIARFYEEDREFSRHVFRSWMDRAYDEDDPICQRWHAVGVFVIRELQKSGYFRSDIDADRIEYVMQSVYASTIAMWLDTDPAPFDLREELGTRIRIVIDGLKGRRDA